MVTVGAVLALAPPGASAINLHFLNYDPVTQMKESDWELESEVFLKTVEEASDGTSLEWENPETGNSGTITALKRFQGPQGEPCRRIRETFKSKSYDSQYTLSVCKNADGEWKVESLR